MLDIVFDGRNKEYGAYILRKDYNRRLYLALSVTGSIIALLLLFHHYFKSGDPAKSMIFPPPIELQPNPVSEKPKEEPPRIIPPKPQVQPRIRTVAVTPPVIVRDPPREEMPPENAALDNVRIGTITEEGAADHGIVAPPLGTDNGVTGVIEKPADHGPDVYLIVQIESMYPGGVEAWRRFLFRTLHYPPRAQEAGVQGAVVVQFIVDTVGAVSHVEAVDGPEELRNEAVRVISKSGHWTPAIQNGRKVKSYKKQPIVFQVIEE